MNALAAAEHFAVQQRISASDLEAYREAKNPGQNVMSIANYAGDVAALLNGKGLEGDTLPWQKTHEDFRFRPGEVTLWHGINGHGKSAVTTQVALYLAFHGRKSCIASFEMLPHRTAHRMLLQAAGNPSPSDAYFSDFFVHLTDKIWIYDKRGRLDTGLLFAAMRYCAEVKGCSHFFVDSLMKCVHKEDDYNEQKGFVSDLQDVAKDTGLHVHLVHHVRKGEDEKKIPTKFDAKGTGAITDLVENVLAVWRNKQKERDRENAIAGVALDNETPDFLLMCDKQRNGGWEGKWALWGDLSTWHFREQSRVNWTRGYEIPKETK